jgi:hypothetical protein
LNHRRGIRNCSSPFNLLTPELVELLLLHLLQQVMLKL